MAKPRINVAIGVAMGVLVGFVFGSVFGKPGSSINTDAGNAKGDISSLSKYRNGFLAAKDEQVEEKSDTLKLSAVDEDGEAMQIIIIK